MAKVLASRAPSDDAFQERLERAAASFPSIHDRWSSLPDAPAREALHEAHGTDDAERAPLSERRDVILPVTAGGVCVTPILGIITDAEEEPRPRFKTLVGVPRSAPDAAEDAGSSAPPTLHSQAEPAPGRGDTASPRATPPPLPSRFLGLPEATRATEAAAARSRPDTSFAPPSRPAVSQAPSRAAPRAALAHSSQDVAAELARQRRWQRRRSWLVGVASFAATLVVFALAAPRERTLAMRWLRDEYQARIGRSLPTVADASRALKPTSVVEPAGASAPDHRALATATGSELTSSELQGIEEPAPSGVVAPRPELAFDSRLATSAPATEVASEPRSGPPQGSVSTAPASGDPMPSVADDAEDARALPQRAARSKTAAASRAKSSVAAPRKRSTRSTTNKSATDVKPRAAGPTKERALRQNSPRRGGNGGIIRETPF